MHRSFTFIDSDIPELLRSFPEFADGMDCLVTCVDSSMNVRESLAFDLKGYRTLTHGPFVVLEATTILALQDRLFPGFDEIYYFQTGDWQSSDPGLWERTFTSEQAQFSEDVPQELRDIMKLSHAVRYSSDGYGLNIAAESTTLLRAACSAVGVGSAMPPVISMELG